MSYNPLKSTNPIARAFTKATQNLYDQTSMLGSSLNNIDYVKPLVLEYVKSALDWLEHSGQSVNDLNEAEQVETLFQAFANNLVYDFHTEKVNKQYETYKQAMRTELRELTTHGQ